jgi:predicted TIM-barrel fold metal-dependent hydrolase
MRCDCHVHIVGNASQYPQAASRTYLAQPAALDKLRRRATARGVDRFVIVQPSFYGTDNRLLLESLDALGPAGRGVAVINAAAPREELAGYAARGVRGVRLNLYSPLSSAPERALEHAFAGIAAAARTMQWHVEVIAPIRVLAANAERLADVGVPVVIDHYGVHGATAPDSPDGQQLLRLLARPHVWIKLSAPYRVSEDHLCTRPRADWLAAILAVAADRCVWGSDWPHTPAHEDQRGPDVPTPHRDLCYDQLVDDFLDALGSAPLADRVMWDNPARLYGF